MWSVVYMLETRKEGRKVGEGRGGWEGQVNMYKHRKTNYMVQLCITV